MRNHKLEIIAILAVASLLLCQAHNFAQAHSTQGDLRFSPVLSWTVDRWTGDDKSYTAIRQSVSQAIKDGRGAVNLANEYKREADRKPLDPQAVFRYAYATYQAGLRDPAFAKTGSLFEAEHALGGLIPTHSYEVTRLRFLLEGTQIPQRDLLPVGERLLRRNPNDFYVKYYLVLTLDGANFPQDAQRQEELSRQIVRVSPNSPSVYAMLGSTYFGVWTRTKAPADKAQALAAFQKYLQLSPPSDAYRNHVQFTINWLQQGQVPTQVKAAPKT